MLLLLLPTLLQLDEPLVAPPSASTEMLCLSNDFLGTVSTSFEVEYSLIFVDGEDFLIMGLLYLSPDVEASNLSGDNNSSVAIVDFLLLKLSLSGVRAVFVIENLEFFGDAILVSSFTCSITGF